jgi:hypothetical protein
MSFIVNARFQGLIQFVTLAFIFQLYCIPWVIPQSLHGFKWQHSALVSETVWSPFLSHVIAVTMHHISCVHLGSPFCHCCVNELWGRQYIILTIHAGDSSTIAWSMRDLYPNIATEGWVSLCCKWPFLHLLILSLVFHTFLILNTLNEK